MNKLQPVIFLMPVIALTLVILIYFILLKGETNNITFKRFFFITIVFAFLLNFGWEILQLPLYKNNVYDLLHISLFALASLADAIMVVLIYFAFALIYKNGLWIKNLTIPRALLLILTGGVGAVLAEMRHLSQEDWAYASSMPVIPFVNAGVSPVLQFMILPIMIFKLSFLLTEHFRKVEKDKG